MLNTTTINCHLSRKGNGFDHQWAEAGRTYAYTWNGFVQWVTVLTDSSDRTIDGDRILTAHFILADMDMPIHENWLYTVAEAFDAQFIETPRP